MYRETMFKESQFQTSFWREVYFALKLGVPLILTQVLQTLLGATDTLVVGRYSHVHLAAIVLATSYFFVFYIFAIGFPMICSNMIAAALDKPRKARRILRSAFWITFFYALIVFPLFWYSAPILRAAGQENELAELAQSYIRVVWWALWPSLIFNLMRGYFSARERTFELVTIVVLAVVLNLVLNILFVFGWGPIPEMGLVGAAYATLIVSFGQAAALMYMAHRIYPEVELFARLWRFRGIPFAKTLRLGFPLGFTTLFEVGLFVVGSFMVGWFGADALASHGIVIQICSITFMLHLGLSFAASIRVTKHWANRDREMVRIASYAAASISVVFSLITALVFILFGPFLCGLFLDQSDPNAELILTQAGYLLLVGALFQMVDGLQAIYLGLLRGLEDTFVPMVMALISYWFVGLGISYFTSVPLEMGFYGVWYGYLCGLSVAAVVFALRFYRHQHPYPQSPPVGA